MSQSPTDPTASSSPDAASTKTPRSPTERLLVWGGIIGLLALAGFQARAKIGCNMTYDALKERLVYDEGPNAKPLLVDDLDEYLVGWPSRADGKQRAHFAEMELTWQGLTGPLGLTVAYDPSEEGGTVMTVQQTTGFVPLETRSVAPQQPDPTGSTTEPGAGSASRSSTDAGAGSASTAEPAAGE